MCQLNSEKAILTPKKPYSEAAEVVDNDTVGGSKAFLGDKDFSPSGIFST